MSLFDRWQSKWKHADPAVRIAAVRAMHDQRQLGGIAADDPSEEVRLAAIGALTDQETLERLAAAGGTHAVAACARVTAPAALARLAQSAGLADVRRRAVEGVTERGLLLHLANADPDATVRALARARGVGVDQASTYLREMIAKLQVAERLAADAAEFRGTLDEVCRALTQDPRFFINGELAPAEEDGAASVADATQMAWTMPALPAGRVVARFIAQARTSPVRTSPEPGSIYFYHIKVWRTGEDRFDAVAVEKRMGATSDAGAWSQASGGGPAVSGGSQ